MELKKIFLIFASLILVLSGCAADSSDDAAAITWTEIFSDDFARANTTFTAGGDSSLGSNYRAVGDNGGTIQITSGAAVISTDGEAEYQTPLTVHTVKLTVKFNSDTFPNVYGDIVLLQDAVSTGSGCQVSAMYASDGTDYGLYVIDKDDESILATAAVTLSTATQYILEMIISGGAVTGTIKDASGTELATTTASAADSSNKYVDCLMVEPSFGMELTGNVTFDDFTISTGE